VTTVQPLSPHPARPSPAPSNLAAPLPPLRTPRQVGPSWGELCAYDDARGVVVGSQGPGGGGGGGGGGAGGDSSDDDDDDDDDDDEGGLGRLCLDLRIEGEDE
jgi:hypothetical protein